MAQFGVRRRRHVPASRACAPEDPPSARHASRVGSIERSARRTFGASSPDPRRRPPRGRHPRRSDRQPCHADRHGVYRRGRTRPGRARTPRCARARKKLRRSGVVGRRLLSSSPRIRLRLRVGARSRVTRRHAWVTWRRISCPPRLPRRRRPPPRRRRRARARSSGDSAPTASDETFRVGAPLAGSRSRRVAVHLRQKTSPQHLQWCRLLMRVNSDARRGWRTRGRPRRAPSGTGRRDAGRWRRGRSTTSARREGRARGRRRGAGVVFVWGAGSCGGVERRVRRGRERRRRRRGVARDHAGVVVRYATGVRANLATRDTPRVRGVATADVMLRGWKRAREGPSRGWSASARRSPHHLEPPASLVVPLHQLSQRPRRVKSSVLDYSNQTVN